MMPDPCWTYDKRVKERLEAAIAQALPFGLADDRVACESMIFAVDIGTDGKLAAARMYLRMIEAVGGMQAKEADRPRVIKWFDRAVYFRERACEMPHLVEEMQNFDQVVAQERSRVVSELGFDPKDWPSAGASTKAKKNAPKSNKRSTSMLPMILAIVSMLVGLLSTAVMIVMFLASGANATDVAIRQMKWMVASVILVQALALGSSIALLIVDRGWLASGAGLLPAAYAIGLTIVLVKLEW